MSTELHRAWLDIRFAEGERPHLFWVSDWTHEQPPRCIKVLSKLRADGQLELVVVESARGAPAKLSGRRRVPRGPAGWLERWVAELATELGVRFERFDLRAADTRESFLQVTAELGWLADGIHG